MSTKPETDDLIERDALDSCWLAVDRLLDELVPREPRPDLAKMDRDAQAEWAMSLGDSPRDHLDQAISDLVFESQDQAAKEHGRLIRTVVLGEHFGHLRNALDSYVPPSERVSYGPEGPPLH